LAQEQKSIALPATGSAAKQYVGNGHEHRYGQEHGTSAL